MAESDAPILIVDDDKDIREILSHVIREDGHKAVVAKDGDTALKLINAKMPDMMLLDLKMPGMDGMEVLRRAMDMDEDLPVVMITAYADIQGAVEAMRAGAHDYLAKPFDNHEVSRVVLRGLAERNLKRKLRNLSGQNEGKGFLKEMMGPSDAIGRLISDVNCVARSNFSVVILGETGSGKELVAQAIHKVSPRSESPFVAVDCGAIPETLLESELFGHEKGAFTGAGYQKPGKFELAKGGTLFLDEISNMPLGSQVKLLRVLQEKKVYRVGGSKPIRINVRLLVASNRDLLDLTESGSFRSDLFFRLNEFTITVPPLRERKEDIPYLAKRFLDITNEELNKNVKGFSESAFKAILGYEWPGNVRQLRSSIRRAVLLSNDKIAKKDLDLKTAPANGNGLALNPKVSGLSLKGPSLKEIVRRCTKDVEREVLSQVLKSTGGNKAKAARMLQIDYKTIHTKVKQLAIKINGDENE